MESLARRQSLDPHKILRAVLPIRLWFSISAFPRKRWELCQMGMRRLADVRSAEDEGVHLEQRDT